MEHNTKGKMGIKEFGAEIKNLNSRIKGLVKILLGHKRLEEKLRASEVRYHRLFETAQDGILILDAGTGQIDDVNPFLIKMLGYSKEEFCGKRLWEIGAFVDMDKAENAFKELQTKKYIRYEDLPLQTKNGHLIDVEFVSNVYNVDLKKVIQCNIRDITARKKAEEERVALEASYHSIFDSVTDAILIQDINTYKIVDVNKKACEMFCYPKEKFINLHSSVISKNEPPHTQEEFTKFLSKAAGGENQVFEWLVKDRFDRQFWVEKSVKRAIIGNGYRLLTIIHDITERKEAEALSEETNKRRSDFVTDERRALHGR